ncbi:MAG: alpha/beta hydrolase [Steroidobacteraceae bacterium]
MSRAILKPARAGSIASQRVLLLPPAYSQPEDFLREGFAEAVRARGLDLDLALIELRLQSVTDRSVLEELARLIVAARTAGCLTVWLGGISLGAYIALACAERHCREVDGLCLFAPYLGSHIVTQEIERAGGVGGWEPGELSEEDEERRIWRFIKREARGPLPIHLGLGREDRFGVRHRTLAAALDARNVDVVAGGHEWPVWRTLWERFLDARIQRQSA